MGSIDKYDYEAVGANVDKAVLAAERKKRETIRKRIAFFVKALICHVAAVVLYLVVFANTGDFKSYYDIAEERVVLIVFSIIAVAVFGAIISIELYKNTAAREAYIKDRPFEKAKMMSLARDGVIGYSIIYLALQLPEAVYHLFAGYHLNMMPTNIDQYFP